MFTSHAMLILLLNDVKMGKAVSSGFQVVTIKKNLERPLVVAKGKHRKNTRPASYQGDQCKRAGKVTLNIKKV